MRDKVYNTIEPNDRETITSTWYDILMMFLIFFSIIPLAFKASNHCFEIIDIITVSAFILDYLLRWITADLKFHKHSLWSFIRYPFSPMAIIDLLSILPSLMLVNRGFKLLRLVRLLRTVRVARAFKALRYSKNFQIILAVLQRSKQALMAVGTLAFSYIIIAALVIFNVEPNTFDNFFQAIYWATVSLTTVGYGDIYPVTIAGQIVTMVSSVLGIAIIALPAGIITAGYMAEIQQPDSDKADATENEK